MQRPHERIRAGAGYSILFFFTPLPKGMKPVDQPGRDGSEVPRGGMIRGYTHLDNGLPPLM
ncbi:hypothetical protein EGY05_13730 [Chryseobacterium arthrosphaerae]|nr:hypothetical protein EGY05_13730 [Chryseobacterium arthrosphaerae]